MTELVIRQADEQDIEAIAQIEKSCFAIPWSRKTIAEEILDNSMALYLVAEIDSKVMAYMGMWLIIDEGHITNIAVLPEYRRQKIASALVGVSLDLTEQEGIRRHTLEVRSSNESAKSLYRSFGFKEAGLRKGYYRDNGEDAVIMWRDPAVPPKN